jgi:hypothetical protein
LQEISGDVIMAIKAIWFGNKSDNLTLNLTQRGGNRVVLATTITFDLISENVGRIDSETATSFGLDEIPAAVATSVVKNTKDGDPCIVVLEYGKPVSESVRDTISEYVGKCLKSVAA